MKTNHRKRTYRGLILTLALVGTGAIAQPPPAKAKITMEEARRTALARVPGGQITSEELEKEHGKLIYSFDLKVNGKSGIEEVNVDANTVKILSVEHEGPEQEKAEQALDAAQKAKR